MNIVDRISIELDISEPANGFTNVYNHNTFQMHVSGFGNDVTMIVLPVFNVWAHFSLGGICEKRAGYERKALYVTIESINGTASVFGKLYSRRII